MPDWRARIIDRLASVDLDPVADAGLIDELAQHLEDRYREWIARGAREADAIDAAMRELEGHESLAAELARRRPLPPPLPLGAPARAPWWSGIGHDVRYALRTLGRSPGFAITAILTVALTTGPTTAIVGVANWLFVRPVPGVVEPDRLATVNFGTPTERGYTVSRASYAHIANLVAASPSVTGMAGWQPQALSVTAGQDARVVMAEHVSHDYFDLLGVRLLAGRDFLPEEDDTPGGALVILLSEGLAAGLFPGTNPVGEVVRANGHVLTVVGVVPSAFSGSDRLRRVDAWITGMTAARVNHFDPDRWVYEPDRGPFYQYVARLAPGATFDRADLELRTAALALSENDPAARKFSSVRPMLHPGFGDAPPRLGSLLAVLAAVAALLVLLGTANLANLFVFRTVRRTGEHAVRRALGASGVRLTRLQIAETVLVALAGGLAGLALVPIVRGVGRRMLDSVGGRFDVSIDWTLVAATTALAVAVGVILGGLPARLAARTSLAAVVSGGSRAAGRVGARWRTGFAALQLVFSLTLLVGALLFVSTLANLRHADAGFDPTDVTTARFGFRMVGRSGEAVAEFFRRVVPVVQAQPGIAAVAVADGTPMLGGGTGLRPHRPGDDPETATRVDTSNVSAEYFRTLGIDLIDGRAFAPDDEYWSGQPPGVVVSQSLARRLFGEERALGHLLTFPATLGTPAHDVPIVGVAEDVRADGPMEALPEIAYLPFAEPRAVNEVLLVRSTLPAADVARLIRDTAAAIEPGLPVTIESMEGIVTMRLGQERLFAWVLSVLAGLGFLLAVVGIHGLVSQTVVERTREFGVRLAIGASRGQIMRLVFRSALLVMLIGAPVGLVVAYFASRVVESRLYGVRPADPAVYATAIGALLIVVFLASLIPARTASRANPVDVLRAE